MVSDKFRQQLRTEVQQWHDEGLIDNSLYEGLIQRYRLHDLENSARNRFILILFGLGCILVGLAAITLVSANWQGWSVVARTITLVSVFLIVNSLGFYLWQQEGDSWQYRAGQGLLLLGVLVLGANLGLMSQMFHQGGELYQLLLVWALGALVMAYGLKLTFLGVSAVIIGGWGYVLGIPYIYNPGQLTGYQLALQHFPILALILAIPLAYWCRSRWLYGLGIWIATIALEVNLIFLAIKLFDAGVASAATIVAIATTLAPALLWAYRYHPRPKFNSINQKSAILFISVVFYLFSFRWFWYSPPNPGIEPMTLQDWFVVIDAIALIGVALYYWWRLGWRPGQIWKLDFASVALGIALMATAGIVWWNARFEALGVIAVVAFNSFLILLALGLIRYALIEGTRQGFWWGMLLIVAQILSRMLEYNTGLLLKAAVLFVCGAGAIAAGFWFERYLRSYQANISETR